MKKFSEMDREEKKEYIKSETWSWVKTLGLTVIIVLLLTRFVIINAVVPTSSMENTVMPGDRILGLRLSYLFSEPKRGDIIIFPAPDDPSVLYVKRIIGLPGETVEIENGVVYIGDSYDPLPEPYLREIPVSEDFGPMEIPEGCYFTMGDNRNDSFDARYWNQHYVEGDTIKGKVYFKYWKGFSWLGGDPYDS